jgi:Flp pilus assembly protein TadG
MNLVKDESGQATVFMGLCMAIFLFGFFALAVDAGLLYREKRLVQTAADAGALAAAAGESAGTSITASAQTAAAQNGLTLGTGKGQASVTATTLTGTGTVGYVQVVATVHTPTVFLGLVSSRFNPMDISASAQASYRVANNACFTALSSTGITNGSMYPVLHTDILVDGSGGISTPNCGVCGSSTGSGTVGVYASQSGHIATLSLDSAGGSCGVYGSGDTCTTQGGKISNPAGTGPPATETSTACSDPYAGSMPTITPGTTVPTGSLPWTPPNGGGGTYTMNPGTYNNFDASNVARLNLNPGLYIFTGTFNSGGGTTITGNGVTLYFAPGSSLVSYSNGGSCNCGILNNTTLTLAAPTNPASIAQGISGIVVYDGSSASSPDTFEFGGGSNSTITGAIYVPHTNLMLGNGTSTQSLSNNIIANTIQVIGGSTVTDTYNPTTSGASGGVNLSE